MHTPLVIAATATCRCSLSTKDQINAKLKQQWMLHSSRTSVPAGVVFLLPPRGSGRHCRWRARGKQTGEAAITSDFFKDAARRCAREDAMQPKSEHPGRGCNLHVVPCQGRHAQQRCGLQAIPARESKHASGWTAGGGAQA